MRGNLGRADRAFRRFFVRGQRRIAELFETRGVEFDLAGRRLEAAVLVLPVLERDFIKSLLLELVESHADAAGGELRVEHVLDRLGAERKFHPPRQRNEHFLVGFAFADLHGFLLGQHDIGRDRRQADDLIELRP